jgi:PAS domain
MADATDLLELLPAAVYTTDAQGRITFYNQAAAELWDTVPRLGPLNGAARGGSTGPMGDPWRMTNAPWQLP